MPVATSNADRLLHAWVGLRFPLTQHVFDNAEWSRDLSVDYCQSCGESVGKGEQDESGCARCRRKLLLTNRVVRLGSYDGELRDWIIAGKFNRWTSMLDSLGHELGKAVGEQCKVNGENTIVVPVPMPWQRRLYRGIDHAQILADALADELRLKAFRVLRKRNGQPQIERSKTDRERRERNWIRPTRRIGGWPLDDIQVILVDDVRTTGTTLKVAARELRKLGARRVIAAIVAVADESGRRSANNDDGTFADQ